MTTKKPKPAATKPAPKKSARRPTPAKTAKPRAAGPKKIKKPPAKPKAKAKTPTTKPAPKKSAKRAVGRPKRFNPKKAALPDLADPLRQAADWIVAGIPDAAIDEAVIAVTKCTRADAALIRAAAYGYLAELIAADPATRKTWHMAARLELYRRTLTIHDYKTARDILRDLAQLEGLYPKTAAKAPAAGADATAPELDLPSIADLGTPTVQ